MKTAKAYSICDRPLILMKPTPYAFSNIRNRNEVEEAGRKRDSVAGISSLGFSSLLLFFLLCLFVYINFDTNWAPSFDSEFQYNNP